MHRKGLFHQKSCKHLLCWPITDDGLPSLEIKKILTSKIFHLLNQLGWIFQNHFILAHQLLMGSHHWWWAPKMKAPQNPACSIANAPHRTYDGRSSVGNAAMTTFLFLSLSSSLASPSRWRLMTWSEWLEQMVTSNRRGSLLRCTKQCSQWISPLLFTKSLLYLVPVFEVWWHQHSATDASPDITTVRTSMMMRGECVATQYVDVCLLIDDLGYGQSHHRNDHPWPRGTRRETTHSTGT